MDEPYPDRVHILLVEDDENDHILVRDLLSHLSTSGSTLSWVPDYDEALSALLTGEFDVCLLDHRLGTRNGIEFLEEATRSGCPTPIIFLSGAGNYETDFAAMKSGAADYVGKDEMSAALLERAIRYSMERAEAKKRLQEAYDKLEERVQERAEELVRANRALVESQRNYRVLAERVPGMLFQFVLHGDGSFSLPYVNKRFEEYSGLSAQSAMADASLILTPIHPDDLEIVRKIVLDSAKTLKGFSLEHRIIDARGQVRWFRMESQPERLPNGDVLWNSISIDITERKQSEELLLKSRVWFHALFENAPLPYQSLDERGFFLDVNRKWLDGLGYEKNEVVGRWFGDFLAPGSVDHFSRSFAILKQANVVEGVEHDMVKKGGEIIRVSFDGRVQLDDEKRFVCTDCILRDITGQKLMEETLRASEELFRNVFEHHAAVKLIIDPETGNIINANKAAESYYGWPKERLVQMRIYDINMLSPEEVNQEMAKAKSLSRVHFEFRHRLADGSIREVEVFSSKIEVRGKELLHSIIHDITERKQAQAERKQAEDALRHRTEELQVILDTVPATIWFKDRDNKFLRVNKATCELMGLPATSLEGKYANEVFPDWLAEKYYRDDLEVISSRQPKMGIEEQSCNAAGELRWVSTDKSPWFDAQGNLAGVLVFAVDVTDRKRAEQEKKKLQQQLFQSQKMESVGRLAGGVAHDYNNMIGVIIGYTEIALQSLGPEEPLHADLQEILKAAKRSADITRQLLVFARKQTISPEVLDLNETVDGMLKMLRRLIGENIDLAWHPKAGLWPVNMDPSQIDQILANLAVNARDAIAGVGKVTIETDTVVFDEAYCAKHDGFIPGEFVLLAVSDDGCGMEKQTLKSIFEPFFTTKDVDKGTGLGLATVYGIVKQNGGFINVYSEPGQGTTFKIYLPPARVQVSQEDTPREKKRDFRGTETILLVEDEESILGLGKTVLEQHGYTVLTAHNPADALDLVKGHSSRVHLLISDVVMPAMSGRELFEKLRVNDPKLKCIFMSGYTASVIAHNSVLEGGINFLQKPFSVETLTEKTRDVLDG